MDYAAIRKRFLAASAAALLGSQTAASLQGHCGGITGDAAISGRVRSALRQDRKVNELTIAVETRNGRVQLSGYAGTAAARARAARVAKTVSGVRSVRNAIHLA